MAVTNYFTVDGQIYGEETGGTFRGYVPDAIGSVMATTTSGTSAQNTYRFKPFGSLLAKVGGAGDPAFRWAGVLGYRKVTDDLTYVRERHYASSQAQWTTFDPLWPTEPPYVYCWDNPCRYTDASGRETGEIEGMGVVVLCSKYYFKARVFCQFWRNGTNVLLGSDTKTKYFREDNCPKNATSCKHVCTIEVTAESESSGVGTITHRIYNIKIDTRCANVILDYLTDYISGEATSFIDEWVESWIQSNSKSGGANVYVDCHGNIDYAKKFFHCTVPSGGGFGGGGGASW